MRRQLLFKGGLNINQSRKTDVFLWLSNLSTESRPRNKTFAALTKGANSLNPLRCGKRVAFAPLLVV